MVLVFVCIHRQQYAHIVFYVVESVGNSLENKCKDHVYQRIHHQ